jgi:acyl dehydratase
MPLDYDALMGKRADDQPSVYSDRETMLYALAVGFGSNPQDEAELPFVFEGRALRTVPTMVSVLTPGDLLADCPWDYSQVVLGEQTLELYRPLPVSARLLTNSRVVDVVDKGPDAGAIIRVESDVRMVRDDTALATVGSTVIARGDGGFGGPAGGSFQPHHVPSRLPDMTCDLASRAEQALLFRLCRDRNPLHADPVLARRVGFDKPILHGLATYGVACRAILKTICDYDHTLIAGFDARFTAPAFPGEEITTEMWQDRNIVSFRCVAKTRQSIVIDNGKCTLAD